MNSDKILDVLLQLAPTINWLFDSEPICAALVPPEHLGRMKQLENLGLAHRRNARNYELQRERLIKMLKRESQYASEDRRTRCLSAFASIVGDDFVVRISYRSAG